MLSKLFFFICILISSFIFTTHSSRTQCIHHQKILLLQLRNELEFNSSISTKLVQWNQSDECCKWYGVECDAAGYVITLQLDDESISGGIEDSSSLFRLKYLQKLNLAYNSFYGSLIPIPIPIPKGIGNLTYLTHLNLSYAGFVGQIPAEMLSLTRLVSLDISTGYLKLGEPTNLEMLVQNLTGLRELYLDRVNITSSHERKKWSHIISSHLPNLTSLSLVFCDLYGPLSESFSKLHSLSILRLDGNDLSTADPNLFAIFSSLTTLSLHGCHLNGSFPNMIFQLPTLQYLDLSWNDELSGSIPTFTQTRPLIKYIDLSHCQFTGSIPFTFANLTELSYVDLSNNLFSGSLPSSLFEGLSNLVHLNLGYNSFTGYIPQSLFGLPLLQSLDLSENHFTGQVEEFHIVNVSNIFTLDLSNNRLEGPIPGSFSQLHRLESLWLFGNLFSNNKYLSINFSTYGFPHLQELRIASCNMCDFPDFIKNSDMLEYLDLSQNRIVGEIPSWIWGKQLRHLDLSFNRLTDLQKPYSIPASLEILDLSSNQLRGELHLLIPLNITYDLLYLLLGNNSLSGSIPTSLCSLTYIDVLDLSVNEFSGSIPPCLFHDMSVISVLNLGGNNISGRIPDNFVLDCHLRYLDLNNNTLEGNIPKSLERCIMLSFMNVGNNMINDTFPCMLSSLRVLVLHSNRFHGEVRCHNMINWPYLQILDISSNHFSGSLESINFSGWRAMVIESDAQFSYYSFFGIVVTLIMKGQDMQFDKIWLEFNAIDLSSNNFIGDIPIAIGDLTSLHNLNLSHNSLNGSIPKSFGQLSKLESLDLSRNQLTGGIPIELGGLTFLEVLNLSYNKLIGMIPNGRQLQTLSADSFEGNPGLCGFPLNISCSHTKDNEDETEQEKREIEWEYVCAALGYAVGLGIIVWLLLFSRSFREKYFGKIEEVVEDIFIARDMRRRRARLALRNRARRH